MDTIKNLFIDFVDYMIESIIGLVVFTAPFLIIALLFIFASMGID